MCGRLKCTTLITYGISTTQQAKPPIWTDSTSTSSSRFLQIFPIPPYKLMADITMHITGGATPWDTLTYYGQLTSQWGIDGIVQRFTTLGNYLAYTCYNSGSLQSLCIAPLTTPTSIGTTHIISTPSSSWKEHGGSVNDAPAALYHGGKTYLTFSASSCWTNCYALRLLTWDGVSDPATSAAWSKKGAVLTSANGDYGPGSNGFVSFLSSPISFSFLFSPF